MKDFLRVAVFALLFMAQMTSTKSSILKAKMQVNKRSLFPRQHINLESIPNGRQEFRMVSSACDDLNMENCQEKRLQPIEDKVAALQEVEFEKKSHGQATGPPIGWWRYANGHPTSTRSTRAIRDTERAIIDDFAEYLTLKRRGALDSCLWK